MINYVDLVLGADTRGLLKAVRHQEDVTRAGVKAERQAGRTGGAMAALGKAGRSAGVALAAGAAAMVSFGAAVQAIAQFETSISRLGAVSRATAAELESMRDIAKDLGSSTEFSATQAADGLNFLAMAGFSVQESIAAIPAVLDLATASGMGLAQAADTASNIMSGFGIEAKNAAGVADVLAAAATRANTDVAQLGQAMSTVAPIAASLEIDLADTAAAVGVLSDAGIQAERAGTALRGTLAALAGPTTQAREVFNRLGVSISEIDPAANSLSDVMGRLGEAGLTTADAMTVFGREAASGALVLIDGANRLGEFGDELRSVDGAASDMATTMRDNLGGDIKGLQSAVSGLILAIGDAGLTAVLRGVVGAITAATRAITFLVEAVGSVGRAFTELFNGASQTQIAIDNVTLAMGDEIGQAQKLTQALSDGHVMSVDVAGAKLAQARAHLASADAQRQEAVEMVKTSEEYLRQQAIIDDNRRILAEYRELEAQGETAGQFEADQIAELNRQLRDAVAAQSALLDGAGATTDEYMATQAEIERLQTALDNSVGGMVNLNGEVVTANQLTERLSNLAAGVGFEGAISDAQSLANWLNVSLSTALQLAATTPSMADEDLAMSQQVIPDATVRETQRQAVANYERIARSAERAGRSTRSAAKATREVTEELTDAERAAESFAKELESNVTRGVDSVAGAFGDFIVDGLRDFQGFASSILDTFKRMIAQMIATAASNQIMISLGLGGSALGTAASSTSGLLGGVGGLGGLASAFGGGMSFFTSGVSSGFAAGGLGGALSGGASALGTAFAGASGGLGGLAAAAGAVALPALAVVGLVSFLKTKKKTIDTGISGVIGMENAVFSTYEEIQKSRFWGLSKKRSTKFKTLTGADDDPIQMAVGDIQDGVLGAAAAIGVSSKTFRGFTHEFELSLKGMSDAAKQSAIQEELEKYGHALAGQVAGLNSHRMAGEESYDTLMRLSTSLTTVNDAFRDLGFGLYDASVAGAAGAASFAELFGSLENFTSATATYYDRFYSDEERLTNSTARLSEALGDLGVNAIPATHEAFRNLVDTAMMAGDADLAASLIQLAPAFDQVRQASTNLRAELLTVNEDLFQTGQDYARGLSRAANGIAYDPILVQTDMLSEMRALNARVNMLQSTSEITAANTGKAADNTEGQLLIAEEGLVVT